MPQFDAALFYAPRDVRVSKLELDAPGPGELLVSVQQALTCGTDLKCYRRGHPVLLGELPSPFGHEGAGVVLEVGEGVTRFQLGDRVVFANSAPCGTCFYCEKGQHNLCESLNLLNGTYAQVIRLPASIVKWNTYRFDESLPFELAAFTEPLAVSIRGVEACNLNAGDHLCVIGLGPIGQLMVKVATLRGIKVTGLARNPMKLAMAKDFGGAEQVINISNGLDVEAIRQQTTAQGRGFDAVIEAVGLPDIWEKAVGLVRRGGLVNWFAGCAGGSQITLDTKRLHYDEITLVSPFHHTPAHVKAAFDLLNTRQLDPSPLISGHYPLAQVTQALENMEAGNGFKYAINPY